MAKINVKLGAFTSLDLMNARILIFSTLELIVTDATAFVINKMYHQIRSVVSSCIKTFDGKYISYDLTKQRILLHKLNILILFPFPLIFI